MKSPLGFRIFVGLVVTAVVAVVVTGLFLAGSPNRERARQFDDRRVNDLQSIASAVDAYAAKTGQVPPDLATLSSQRDLYLPALADPRTGEPYAYQPVENNRFSLCATFELPSEDTAAMPVSQPFYGRFWQHGAGYVCFPLDVQTVPGKPAPL